jgi:KaiC/GvpD/RAD55 family RecA-like ATPase
MSKKLTNDETRVERLQYLIERLEYSENNPTTPIGIDNLDDSLYGGIPTGYAILLTSPPLDEKDRIIESFIHEGLNRGETVLLLSTMVKSVVNSLVMNKKDTFYLMLCSPWGDDTLQNMPNVCTFSGVEDLTQLNITLRVFLRDINEKVHSIDRVVIDLISDSLLIHETRVVRRWLMDLITMFKQQNITSLSTMDQGMHSASESRVIIDLFDGHLEITENKSPDKTENVLKINRLYNKKYQKKDLALRSRQFTR